MSNKQNQNGWKLPENVLDKRNTKISLH